MNPLSRPSVARVCVEVDLLKDLPKRIWLGVDDSGFFQRVTYEDLPNYCTQCCKIGHSVQQCRKGTKSGDARVDTPSQANKEIDTAAVKKTAQNPNPVRPRDSANSLALWIEVEGKNK